MSASPPFAVIGTEFSIVPRETVVEILEKNALMQGKDNITLGPIFRKVADDFRRWSEVAEPGCMMLAPEISLTIIRLSRMVHPVVSLSQPEQANPNGRPQIVS